MVKLIEINGCVFAALYLPAVLDKMVKLLTDFNPALADKYPREFFLPKPNDEGDSNLYSCLSTAADPAIWKTELKDSSYGEIIIVFTHIRTAVQAEVIVENIVYIDSCYTTNLNDISYIPSKLEMYHHPTIEANGKRLMAFSDQAIADTEGDYAQLIAALYAIFGKNGAVPNLAFYKTTAINAAKKRLNQDLRNELQRRLKAIAAYAALSNGWTSYRASCLPPAAVIKFLISNMTLVRNFKELDEARGPVELLQFAKDHSVKLTPANTVLLQDLFECVYLLIKKDEEFQKIINKTSKA